MEVFEPSRTVHVDLAFLFEGLSDLACQALIDDGVAADIEGEPGQCSRSGLASCTDKNRTVDEDFVVGQLLVTVAVLGEHVTGEVSAAILGLGAKGHARLRLGHGHLSRLLFYDEILVAKHEVNHRSQKRVKGNQSLSCNSPYPSEEVADEWSVSATLETVKRIREGQVANDVKCREVEPVNNVDGVTRLGVLAKLVQQEVDILGDDCFLLFESSITKRMGKCAALAAVVFRVA